MFPNVSGTTQRFLADVTQNETELQQTVGQLSSGLRVQQPSDDPAAIMVILESQASIAHNQQIQSNLGSVKTEVSTADSALQSAVQAVESAISMAAQGGTATATTATRAALSIQVQGLLESLVGISQTNINGNYIFSGDENSPPYQLDPTSPTGVKQLVNSTATRVIQAPDGTTFAVAKTAADIFDARNPDGTPAANNVFAAVNSLITALNDPTANAQNEVLAAASSLKAADTYLNSQLAFYGDVENRVQSGIDLAQKFLTQQQTQLSGVRDADIAALSVQLNQEQVQEQASMSAEASIQQIKNLFSYLA